MLMERIEAFWNAEKSLIDDIVFTRSESHPYIFEFRDLTLTGESCDGVFVEGNYNCHVGSFCVHFNLEGIGGLRRFCLNGPRHGDAGRYHEHIPRAERDVSPAQNLPYAVPRPDLEELDPVVAWRTICKEAKIAHAGSFRSPTEYCQ